MLQWHSEISMVLAGALVSQVTTCSVSIITHPTYEVFICKKHVKCQKQTNSVQSGFVQPSSLL